MGKPRRRGGGWSPQDNRNTPLMKNINDMIQPIKIKNTLLRLHLCPGKFCQPNHVKACFRHQLYVSLPALLRPLFRIVINAKTKPNESYIQWVIIATP